MWTVYSQIRLNVLVNDRQCSDITKKKHHHADKDWREGSRRGWRRQRQPAAITERLSLSLSLSLSLYLSAAAHKTNNRNHNSLSPYVRPHTRTRFGNPPLRSLPRSLSLSLSSLSCAVFSYAQQHQQEVFRVPSESLCSFNTGVLLLLRRSAQQW